jgi:hypothetical protein
MSLLLLMVMRLRLERFTDWYLSRRIERILFSICGPRVIPDDPSKHA